MEPVMASLKREFKNKVIFITADVDDPEGRQLAEKYQVRTIPALFYLQSNGEVSGTDTGLQDADYLRGRIEKLLRN